VVAAARATARRTIDLTFRGSFQRAESTMTSIFSAEA
jgi:hypothetical protein